MTIDDFWKKYNRCPKCKWYFMQPNTTCDYCRYTYPCHIEGHDMDCFEPTAECVRTMNKEIDEI